MSHRTNSLGQPIGPSVDDWTPRQLPPQVATHGASCRLEPLDPGLHGSDLYEAFAQNADGSNWTYLTVGPFTVRAKFDTWLAQLAVGQDPQFKAIIDTRTGAAVGIFSLMRIDPINGVIEVGNIHFSPLLQRTRAASEAMYLLIEQVFDTLGYRRFEWKCDALNAPSRSAAERFGFTHEGVFRQLVMYRGRSRDTAWFSIIHTEWPRLRLAYLTWLDADNFDADGNQHRSLRDLMAEARARAAADEEST